jgi:putative component of membrane protein insertase Oxa1/YidC/SpoIIIJ protein YidD
VFGFLARNPTILRRLNRCQKHCGGGTEEKGEKEEEEEEEMEEEEEEEEEEFEGRL